ncbi:HipA N-terminal domain-containing protein [Idiomarina sp. OT37-5b]|jgi:HipA-like protein|uniref:HipA N-terminal domain-containing protein n=1 Tax=Idiomarina sp. OT37-5b TaxID=2100422 RepID=UPI00131A261B|nr:HipA N-terminal domain-containing protein [Idiomarina sp. OT37-5b]
MISNTATRQLQVFINAENIGLLRENNGLWQFEYAQRWLQQSQAFTLAPYLPLQAEPRQITATRLGRDLV